MLTTIYGTNVYSINIIILFDQEMYNDDVILYIYRFHFKSNINTDTNYKVV